MNIIDPCEAPGFVNIEEKRQNKISSQIAETNAVNFCSTLHIKIPIFIKKKKIWLVFQNSANIKKKKKKIA